jgi:hypothetical protein
MSWNKIDLDSSFKKGEDKDEKLKFSVEDEKGNSLLNEEEDVSVTEEDNEEDNISTDEKKKTKEDSKKETSDEDEDDAGKKEFKKSRAQERIRELVRLKKESEAKLSAEVEDLRKQLSLVSKDSLATQKEFIDTRLVDIKRSMAKAQEEGKFEEATELMSQLADLQTKKVVVDSTKVQEVVKKESQNQQQEEPDDTEFLSWSVRNRDWLQKDLVKTRLATSISKKIDKEGIYSPDTPEYWIELDERLHQIWGEDEDMSSNNEEDLQSSSKKEVKSTKKPPQTTSGASRTPAAKSGGKMVINLTKDEQALARKLGMSNLDWAKQKYRQQKNTDENGYQVLFDN